MSRSTPRPHTRFGAASLRAERPYILVAKRSAQTDLLKRQSNELADAQNLLLAKAG